MIALKLGVVAILIAWTAFFVAAEFAIVKVRSTRVDQWAAQGSRRARKAKTVITHLDEYLSACQLGITITALGLGWLGEPTMERLLHPLFERLHIGEAWAGILSFSIAFIVITFLHVVIGELAPKTFAIQKAERITLLFSGPLIYFYKIMYPFIWVLNGSARVVTGLFGIKMAAEHEQAHSEEELRLLLSESYQSGEINSSEYQYVNNIFTFDDRVAKEVMVPRTEIEVIDTRVSAKEAVHIMKRAQHTRYPIVDGDKDHIKGVLHMKEILADSADGRLPENKKAADYIRPILRVIESMAIHDLLVKMQKERVPIAILLDEYGGTAGMVTVEDILEEIVGEIRDEFDRNEPSPIEKVGEAAYVVEGKVLISELNDVLEAEMKADGVDTVGGWLLTRKEDIRQNGIMDYKGYRFEVLKMENDHIQSVKVEKNHPSTY